ncbi:MAG: polynucleotide adenylyltransferase PcnB [Polyangiales bacterium]
MPFKAAAERIDLDAAKVVRRLTRAGFSAFLVGGCVRDLLLDRKPKDFDVATDARPNEVRNLFRNCRVIGKRFKLAHVTFAGGKVIEVATFRKDPTLLADPGDDWEAPEGESDPRRRPGEDQDLLIRHDNVFGTPPEDAARRDFTMNALFYDLERREVVDFVGGLDDIERRVIRTIGEPDVRFREDPVRILRAIKFAARIDLGIEPDTFDAMLAHRDDLMRAARPRLLEEVLRLMRGGASRRSIWLAWETGVLAVLLPELSSFLDDDPEGRTTLWKRLRVIDTLVAEGDPPTDAVLLAALTLEPAAEHLDGARDLTGAVTDFYEEMQQRFSIPRKMYDRLRQVVATQRRIKTNRHAPLARRDFFPEAAALWTLEQRALGKGRDAIERHLNAHPRAARAS